MSLLLPGLQGRRRTRASTLLFGWRASDGSLDAYTGQAGTFTGHATAFGPVVGLNGVSVTAGRNLPRFTAVLDATTRLRLQGDVAGTYDEGMEFAVGFPVMSLTLFVRLRSVYALGVGGIAEPGNVAVAIGTGSNDGGYLAITRKATAVWHARRSKVGFTERVLSAPAETGSWTHPFDLLLSLTAAGAIAFTLVDGGGVTRFSGTSAADAGLVNGADLWGNGVLAFGKPVIITWLTKGGEFDYEEVKVARGVKTMAEMRAAF